MSRDSKVVQLRSGTQRAALPSVLAGVANSGWQVLADHLQKLLDNADDALFELADRALNANEQNLYFEAMREIRVNRRQLEDEFREELSASLQVLLSKSETPGSAALELLDYDDMEEQVAVESMASKAGKRFTAQLGNLGASFENWAQRNGTPISLAEHRLPLGPLAVCDAFARAARSLDVNIKPKLVLFKLFDRHVVSELGSYLDALEVSLRAAGIFVEEDQNLLRKAPEGEQAAPQPEELPEAQPAPQTDADTVSLSADASGTVFDILKQLLEESRRAEGGAQSPGESGVQISGTIHLSRMSLMSILQELQTSQLERLAVRGTHAMEETELTQLPGDLASRLRDVSRDVLDDSDETLAQRDFDVINLVSLLFQYVLEDESLAGPMKGLIAYLQIPVLKAAMLDKRFFSKEGHPARLLLNTISDACLGWHPHGDVEDDPLYIEVDSVVKHVLARSDGSADVFQEALDDLTTYLEQERRKADVVTQRVLDAEGGKAVADEARKRVKVLLQEKLAEHEKTPEALRTLLEDGWSKVLFLQSVQQGEDSEAWRNAVSVVDNLLWSVQPVTTAAHRDKLLKELPPILDQLRDGLNQIGYNPYDLKAHLQELEKFHLELLKRGDAAPQPKNNEDNSGEAMPREEASLAGDVNLDDLDASLAESLGETPTAGPKELEEAERRLARLQVGNWVEFKQEDGKSLRCRLAAVIASTGQHIFVNRSGMKVAEHEKGELVRKLATDQMSMLDDGMLFDRALESVISNLRDMKDKPV